MNYSLSAFQKNTPFKSRLYESKKFIETYPERVPIICERLTSLTNNTPQIDKKKYLVQRDMTLGQFVYVIKKRLKLTPEKAIFLFINGAILQFSARIESIYDIYKHDDGFLYITYSFENTFG